MVEDAELPKETDWSSLKALSLAEKRGIITLSKSNIEGGRYTLEFNGLNLTIWRIRLRRFFSLSS